MAAPSKRCPHCGQDKLAPDVAFNPKRVKPVGYDPGRDADVFVPLKKKQRAR